MKKLIPTLLLALIVLQISPTCFAVSATESSIDDATYEELSTIVKNTYYLYHETHVYASLDNDNIIRPLDNKKYEYAKVLEHCLPGGSFENMMDIAKNTFAEDILDDAFTYNAYNFFLNEYVKDIPLYVEYENNYYWYDFAGIRMGSVIKPITDDPTHDALFVVENNIPANIVFDRIEVDNDHASGYVLAKGGTDGTTKMWCFPVEFIKTTDGWRLNDCLLFRMYYTGSVDTTDYLVLDKSVYEKYGVEYNPYYTGSPSTGDSAGERVAVIGAVSLACIIPTACLMRRRRRASAE